MVSTCIISIRIVLAPWSYLKDGAENTLPWWKTYNEIKHHGAECYSKGTLEVALNLIAALFIVDACNTELSLETAGFTQIIDWDHHVHMPQLIAITQPNNHLRQKSLCTTAFGGIMPEFLHIFLDSETDRRETWSVFHA